MKEIVQIRAEEKVEKYLRYSHITRINTEEKAKVVAAARGTELIQFLAALVFKNRMNSSFSSNHPDAKQCCRAVAVEPKLFKTWSRSRSRNYIFNIFYWNQF